jgi:hypothetical protein
MWHRSSFAFFLLVRVTTYVFPKKMVCYVGSYELRPAVKKLYQQCSKVSESRVSVASLVVNPKQDELRPEASKEFYHSMKVAFCRKSLNAVSLGVPCTWPPELCSYNSYPFHRIACVNFMNILLFHVWELFKWFSKYVWYIVAHTCVKSCFHSWNEKITSKYQDKQITYQ